MESNSKPAIITSVLVVKHTEYLNPRYVRVTLTGEGVPLYENVVVGANNKIFLPDNQGNVYFDQQKSIRRTYTHRGIDLQKNEMYIDFVAHGDDGPASA